MVLLATRGFASVEEAVAELRRCCEDIRCRAELQALSCRVVDEEVVLREQKMMLFRVRVTLDGQVQRFVGAGGADALHALCNNSLGGEAGYTLQAEVLKTMAHLCRDTVGLEALSCRTVLRTLHGVLSAKGVSLSSALRAVEMFAALACRGHAAAVAAAFEASPGGYQAVLADLLKCVELQLQVAGLLLAGLLLVACPRTTPSPLLPSLRTVCISVKEPTTLALASICAWCLGRGGDPAFSPPARGGGDAGDVARALSSGAAPSLLPPALLGVGEAVLQAREVWALPLTLPGCPSHGASGVEALCRAAVLQEEEAARLLVVHAALEAQTDVMRRQLPQEHRIDPVALTHVSPVGQGGFGHVFRAALTTTGEEVAVKEYRRDAVHGEGVRVDIRNLLRCRQFLRETLLLHRLRHNAVVNFYGWVPAGPGQKQWMVTEYCTGGTLAQRATHALAPAERAALAAAVAAGIAPALAYLHGRHPRLVHLDVAARNVLIANNNTFKLGDVGSLVPEGAADPVICLPWSPPEAMCPGYTASPPHDVWSFGVLLWECLEGRAPFAGLPPARVREELRGGGRPPPPLAVAEEDASAEEVWAAVVTPCWHLSPSRRPTVLDLLPVVRRLHSSSPSVPAPPRCVDPPVPQVSPENQPVFYPYGAASSDAYTSRLEALPTLC